MNEAQQKKLKEYIGQNVLVSIYPNISEPEYFDLGFVLAVNDEFVLLNTVSQFGEETGFLLQCLDDIFMVCQDARYAEKMEKLFQLKKQNKRTINFYMDDLLTDVLMYAKENPCLIQVNNDDNYVGYVTDCQDQVLELHMIGQYGENLGTAYIDFDTINILDMDTVYLRDLQLLYGDRQ